MRQTDQADCKSKAVAAMPIVTLIKRHRSRTMRTLKGQSAQSKGTQSPETDKFKNLQRHKFIARVTPLADSLVQALLQDARQRAQDAGVLGAAVKRPRFLVLRQLGKRRLRRPQVGASTTSPELLAPSFLQIIPYKSASHA